MTKITPIDITKGISGKFGIGKSRILRHEQVQQPHPVGLVAMAFQTSIRFATNT